MKSNFKDFFLQKLSKLNQKSKEISLSVFIQFFDVFEKNLKCGMDVIIKSNDVNAKSIGQQFSFF